MPSAPGRPWVRAGGLVLAGFLAGAVTALALGGQGSGSPAGPPPPAATDEGAGPRAMDAGVPVGYARTGPGAAAAATAFLTIAAESLMLMDPPARDAALRRMLVPDASEATVAAVVGDRVLLDRVRKAASVSGAPRAVLRNLPVAYRVEAVSAERARVSVWATAVWSVAGVGGPGETWTTTAVELEWVDGDWRLWSLSSKDGPTPATTSGPVTGTDALIAALAGYSSYRYGPA